MRKATILAVIISLCVLCSGMARAEGKVGFVDFGKVLELTDKGAAVRKKIAASKESIELQIQTKELELRKMQEELKTKKDVMAKEAFEAKMQEFNQMFTDYQKFIQSNQVKFEELRVKQIRGLVSDIEDVVEKVAKSNGFTLVIMKFEDLVTNSSLVLYGDSSIDLTDMVIKSLNAK